MMAGMVAYRSSRSRCASAVAPSATNEFLHDGRQQGIPGIGGVAVGKLMGTLFSGLGGACLGIEAATGRSPDFAANHWDTAIEFHRRNHPATRHFQSDIYEVDPLEATKGQRLGLLWASPDCRHFSRAKRGVPVSPQVRALAGVVLDWAKKTRPDLICLENVPEFVTWGPLLTSGLPDPDRAGETYRHFIGSLREDGYQLATRTLVAADFGAATSRERFFLVARADGRAPAWPTPTHGPGRQAPYRTVHSCLDYRLPSESMFAPDRRLAVDTRERIAVVLARHVLGSQQERPVPAAIIKNYTGVFGHSVHRPLGTVTTRDHHGLAQCVLGSEPTAQTGLLRDLLRSHGFTQEPVVRTDQGLRPVQDVTYRMLQPGELAQVQGFPNGCALPASKEAANALIGNAVVPQVAQALVGANLDAIRSA